MEEGNKPRNKFKVGTRFKFWASSKIVWVVDSIEERGLVVSIFRCHGMDGLGAHKDLVEWWRLGDFEIEIVTI